MSVRLTYGQIVKMRREITNGFSAKELAEKYKVSTSTVLRYTKAERERLDLVLG